MYERRGVQMLAPAVARVRQLRAHIRPRRIGTPAAAPIRTIAAVIIAAGMTILYSDLKHVLRCTLVVHSWSSHCNVGWPVGV